MTNLLRLESVYIDPLGKQSEMECIEAPHGAHLATDSFFPHRVKGKRLKNVQSFAVRGF